MTEDEQQIRETITRSGDTVNKSTEIKSPRSETEHQHNVAERVVWFITGSLLVMLAFRFLFSLLGANTTNVFASFIYTASHPFVAPFFSLFNYRSYVNGTSHFETYTLIAILLYSVLGWGIAKLVTLNRG